MRRLLLVVALVVVGGGLLGWQVQKDTGYLLIAYGNYTIDMSLWVALALLLLVVLLGWGLRSLWRWLNAPTRSIRSLLTGGHDRGRIQTAQGMLQFAEGRWDQSWKTLKKSIKRSDTPLINCLTAANAAYEAGDLIDARNLLVRADQLATVSSHLAIELLRAKMYLKEGQHQEALAMLKRIYGEQPDHPEVLRLLVHAYQETGSWQQLEELLPVFRRYGPASSQQLVALEVEVYTQRMRQLAEGAQGDASGLVSLWEAMPSNVRRSRLVMEIYVNSLHQAGDSQRAEELLRKVLKSEWDGDLVRLYGIVEGTDAARQLMEAESWLPNHSEDVNLLLTLGRLCQRNKLWGKARDYLESSLSLKPLPEAYAELARLMAQLGEPEKSAHYYQQGLLQYSARV